MNTAGGTAAAPMAARHALAPVLGGGTCALELGPEMLTLFGEDGRTILMLPREEAARYLRFQWDLRRGRVIEFRLLGGLRAMRFTCPASVTAGLTEWLPPGASRAFSPPTLLLLFCGIAGLLWAPLRLPGAVIFTLAALNMMPIRQNLALLNAITCGACALAALFGPTLGWLSGPPAAAFLYGALLALTAVEQLGFIGPNRNIFEARLAAQRTTPGRHDSTLVRAVAYAAGAAGLAFLLVAALLFALTRGGELLRGADDWLVFLAAGLVLLLPAPLLLLRARAPYGQALIVAQFLIAILVVYAWGLGAALLAGGTIDYTRGVFAAAIANSPQPYFALPLLLLEIAFRTWFTRAAEREAAEAD